MNTCNIWIIFVKPSGRGNRKWIPMGDLYFFYHCDAAMFAAKLTVKHPNKKYIIKKYVEAK
jgi:hypothetical protein